MKRYDESYNPIREYWDQIRYKPLLSDIETARRKLKEDELRGKADTNNWIKQKEKLEALVAEKERLEAGGAVMINTSWKVYRAYGELIRIMDDPESGWVYKPGRANHALEFIEGFCKHSKGAAGGQPFILELWQKAAVAATFGIISRNTSLRKYSKVLLMVARKNGKSTLSAAVGLYMQLADGEPGADVYAVATKRDQAKLIWLEAKKMVRKSPALRRRCKTLVGELTAEYNNSSFRPLGRDSDTLDGLNVHCATMDEIHAWTDQNLYDVIADGTTAREEPLIFITTTAGTVRENVFDKIYDEASNLINGFNDPEGYKDDAFLPIIYELDDRREWQDPECWIKANPGLGTIKRLDQLRGKVRRAQKDAANVKNLLCKDFNMPETTTEAWLTAEEATNRAVFDLKELKPRYGIGGADLSATTDLTAAKVIFMVPDDPRIYVLQMYWIPEDLVQQRVDEDKIPYDVWIQKGYMRTCPGNRNDPHKVTEWFAEVRDVYDVYLPWFGYDAWSATYWVQEMQATFGKESMIAVHQGKKTLSSPMKNLKANLRAKRVVYNNNPVDRWCLCNTAVDVDKNDNIQPIKTSNPRRRIDGTAALLNACVVLEDKMNDYMSLI